MGLKSWFKKCGPTNVTEMDWWDEVVHPGSDARIAFTPAQVSASHCLLSKSVRNATCVRESCFFCSLVA